MSEMSKDGNGKSGAGERAGVEGPEELLADGKEASRKSESGKKKKPSRRQLEESLGAAQEEVENLKDKLIRLQAEFENYKKRQAREREEHRRKANEGVLEEMLPVLDNLERAMEHGDQATDAATLLEGVQLVTKQLSESLARFGVKSVDALGQVFDPHEHQAMSKVDTDGDPPDGTIV